MKEAKMIAKYRPDLANETHDTSRLSKPAVKMMHEALNERLTTTTPSDLPDIDLTFEHEKWSPCSEE